MRIESSLNSGRWIIRTKRNGRTAVSYTHLDVYKRQYPNPVKEIELPFEPEKMNKLLGTDISSDVMLSIFKKLELRYDEKTNMLTIPTFRQDLKCMADLAEEVARFYGYANIPTTLPHGESTAGKKSYAERCV